MVKLNVRGQEMFKLKLDGKRCVSCGICMDVCIPGAIHMRFEKSSSVEGELLSYIRSGDKRELPPEKMMTFPFLASPHRCDGCMACVKECPVSALELFNGDRPDGSRRTHGGMSLFDN